ncbi:NAD(P)H-dependent oxidoreductase [Porticoccaceae bacterium]|nr:NAD(P)H-dependent oxidoreductase [Porticoccaceae bacterium]MDA8663784.1 NAD(P)H-dependent oxidoreductase [Porticoccaceae bacterium]MDA8788748.1 NAD(P)H-dependent oxidoreductase [Porticoccaceae bacterium]MDB2343274.1 NAD(P)H-dependent oxidoreductase [Porticoccaceae bacterium]MDB2634096.1 NAD(P)H-dependent oxidoreductase [Porticoccaceae bacterium]
MKILAFAASNSRKSINKSLINYAATLLENHEVEIIDINDYEMPMYSSDLEEAHGIPDAASRFLKKIQDADALLISYAEHNGNYTVAYKNLFDWASRENQKVYQGKSILMLSTSPGPGGARSVLTLATESAHFFNGKVRASLSIPSFYDNFDQEKYELNNTDLVSELKAALATLA